MRQPLMVSSAVYWIGVGCALLYAALPQLRHVFFAMPFLVLIAALGDRGWRLGDEIKPFMAFVGAGLVLSPLSNAEGMKDLFLTFSGVSIGLLLRAPRIKPTHAFAALMVTAVIYFSQILGTTGSLAFSIEESTSPFESSYSFIFGLLAVFVMQERRYWFFLLCLALTVITLKRIAVLGVLLCAVFTLVGPARGRWILNPPVMLLVNLTIVLLLVAYGAGELNGPIEAWTGMSANHLGQGRQSILQGPAQEVLRAPERFIFFGQGPGAAYAQAAVGAHSATKTNLHSDLFKVFYEYGVVFYGVFIWLLYSAKAYRTRVACLYMNVLFVTDNVLIYYFLLLMFVVGVRSFGPGDATPGARARPT